MGIGPNRGVDPNQCTCGIQEGTTGIAWVDAGIRLNEVLKDPFIGLEGTAYCADHSGGNGVAQSERVANGDNGFTENQVRTGAEGRDLQSRPNGHAQHR